MLVGFRLSGQDYALPLDKVAAIARVPPEITALPRSGEAMRGVVAYRGGLLPLVAPHVLLGLTEPATASAAARIVVTRFGTASVGLLVDRTTSIFRVPEAAIDPVPPVLALAAGDASVEAICRLDGGTRLLSVLAPARLFDAETTSRIMANAPREDASVTSDESQSEATEQFVVFRLAEEEYGLPIAAVEEVARRPESLSRVPRSPDYMEGLMNLRGAVVPVIDQSRRFGATTKAARSGGRIVVLTVGGLRAGFAVDEVREVLAVAAGEMAPAPDLAMAGAPLFDRVATLRRDGRMILLIDPQALLDAAERDILAALSAVASAKAPGRTGARTGAGAPAP
ncbi:MAG: chemotaxis protein CheW [Pseudomonadota bacterium]